MTDPTTRDQIVEIVRDNLDGIPRDEIPGDVADALLAVYPQLAGPQILEGMTAEKLRVIVRLLGRGQAQFGATWMNAARELSADLRAWADALELRETP